MYDKQNRAFVAISGENEICLIPRMANRHGLISGATGTGKTVTLQTMAETFSSMGVPVFAADVKGDLSGVAAAGGNKSSVTKRVEAYGLAEKGFSFQAFPVQFWDVFGEQGTPVRATAADMGPLLLSRLLSLNETQTGVLSVVFKIAEDEKLELVDLKDLRKILEYTASRAREYSGKYGNIATQSVGAIQRGLVALEQEGGDRFFGEPALAIDDLMLASGGKGIINILAADKLMQSPRVYTSFLLWLLTKLFATLPEVGDPEKPKLVFFFDEAHLFFNDAPKALLDKIEQVVRLIRSKGVGVYFITQSPADIPDAVLGQLGNRVQHALRAYTPKDQKAVKAAARTFRANPGFDVETAITELGTGEALVSFLDDKGAPEPVERAAILPPQGQIGPLDAAARQAVIQASRLHAHYAREMDRTSAYEILHERYQGLSPKEMEEKRKAGEKARKEAEKQREKEEKEARRAAEKQKDFWSGVAKSVFVPLARKAIDTIFKKR